MFWNNQRRNNNPFFWGMVTGLLTGLYATRWIRNNSNRDDSPKSHSTKEHSNNNLTNKIKAMDQADKQELFSTFLNGSEGDMQEKAKDLD